MAYLYENAEDYLEAGMRLIPLHPIINGHCGCGEPECKAVGKHPLRSNWQLQSLVDSATVRDVWGDAYGCNGLGWALDKDHIVLDIDPRNGGIESLKTLQNDLNINFFDVCTAIVKTGGNGWHFYFKKLDTQDLGWKLPEKYKGCDLKMAGGFVVIAGSMHLSGNDYDFYQANKSELADLAMIPEGLANLLVRTYSEHREKVKASGLADIEEVKDMLSYLSPDMGYHDWVKVGMAIHHATNGTGVAIWDDWSKGGASYRAGECDKKFHSFGKYNGNTVGMGSLVAMARDAGWQPAADSTALSREELDAIKSVWDKKKDERIALPSIADDADIDLFDPPAMLGDIYKYIYASSPYPNKTLALACSLSTLTNVIGRRFYWGGKFANIQPNLLVLCVAGSSVGKDSLIKASHRLLSVCGLAPAIHGRIKSDKDLIDAMEMNQYAMYIIDEFGYVLQRISNAIKKGGASYLEGITATIMEAFTKGDSEMLLDLSRKTALREKYDEIIAKTQAALADGNFKNESVLKAKLERAQDLMKKHATGLPNPFLSFCTFATPRSMESAFSGDATENGFLSRAMAFHEAETNPRRKEDFAGTPEISMGLTMKLKAISIGTHLDKCPFGRVDSFNAERVAIKINHDAQLFVERSLDYFHELAETQKESGLESLPRRALDSIVKVCIALASESGVLTIQMARYAVKLVRMEIDRKIRRVNSTERMSSASKEERLDGVAHRIIEVCATEKGETPAVILNHVKSGKVNRETLEQILQGLTENGYLEALDQGRKHGGKPLVRYKSTGKTIG
jgi:hypothetical protein